MNLRNIKKAGVSIALASTLLTFTLACDNGGKEPNVIEIGGDVLNNGGGEEDPGAVETPDTVEADDEDDLLDSKEGFYRSELTNKWIDEKLENQRPIAVMVDNELTALDHYGVNSADVVYELMNSTANGRVTRLMCLVKDWENLEQFGSIRSTRTTNVMLSGEWNAILIHDGGPFYINDYLAMPYANNLSGGFARFSNGKATEFTEYVTSEKYTNPNTGKSFDGLIDRIKKAGYDTEYNKYYEGKHWEFSKGDNKLADASDAKAVKQIDLPFPHNKSQLKYNADKKVYEYYEYGQAHIDPLDDNKTTSFTNVILECISFSQLDPNGYLTYNVTDSTSHEGYYLTKGVAVPITWSKKTPEGITHYYYKSSGDEIKLNTGKTYIAFVPADSWSELEMK